MERKLNTQQEFDRLYELARKTHGKTGGFINYLKNKRDRSNPNNQAQRTKH